MDEQQTVDASPVVAAVAAAADLIRTQHEQGKTLTEAESDTVQLQAAIIRKHAAEMQQD